MFQTVIFDLEQRIFCNKRECIENRNDYFEDLWMFKADLFTVGFFTKIRKSFLEADRRKLHF